MPGTNAVYIVTSIIIAYILINCNIYVDFFKYIMCAIIALQLKYSLNYTIEIKIFYLNLINKEDFMNVNLIEYLNCFEIKNFNDVLFYYIDRSGHSDSEIYRCVDIDRKLFSKIRCNKNYVPRKNLVIKLCFALRLDLHDSNILLKSAGYSLSNNKFDLIITYCLDNNIYDLSVINDFLFTYCNAIL